MYQNYKYIIVITGASNLVGTGGFFRGHKAAGCEADYSPPSSVKVKTEWRYTSSTIYSGMVCLGKLYLLSSSSNDSSR